MLQQKICQFIRLLIAGLLLLNINSNSLLAQNNSSLKGHIEGINSGKATLRIFFADKDAAMPKAFLPSTINKGDFFIQGKITAPYFAEINFNDSMWTPVFVVEPGHYELKVDTLAPENMQIMPLSRYQAEYKNVFHLYFKEINNSINIWYRDNYRYYKKYNGDMPIHLKDSMQNVFNHLKIERDSLLLQYTSAHPESFVALNQLLTRLRDNGYTTIYSKIFETFNPPVKQSTIGIVAKNLLALTKRVAIGAVFPALEVADIQLKNTTVSNKQNMGKIVLYDFWYSNCGPCIEQFPHLIKLYNTYHTKGFNIIAVSTDTREKIHHWKEVLQREEVPWEQYLDTHQLAGKYLNIQTFPANFLVDGQGKIISRNIDPISLEIYLKKALE